MNCKLYVFIRYLVEKLTFHEMSTLIFSSIHVYSLEFRALQRNSTLIFSSIHVYSLELRALQRNSTLILQTCCRYYDK